MAYITENAIKRRMKLDGAQKTTDHFVEAIASGALKPEEFSLRQLWNATITTKTGEPVGNQVLLEGKSIYEAATGVDSSAFAAINGQIVYSKIIEQYQAADFTVSPHVMDIPSPYNLRGEKFAGISNIYAVVDETPEEQELPSLSPSADYIESSAQQKRGAMVSISREALLMDRTGELLNRCKEVGKVLGLVRELQSVCALTGLAYTITVAGKSVTLNPSDGTNNKFDYNWKGTKYAPYQASTPYINIKTSNPLTSPEAINGANVLLDTMTDPYTSFPLVEPPGQKQCFVTPSLYYAAFRVANNVGYWINPGVTNTGSMHNDHTLPTDFMPVKSKYLKIVQDANSVDNGTWYFGMAKEALARTVGQKMLVEEAVPLSGQMFSRDLVMQFRALEIYTMLTWQPRYLVKNTP